MKSTSRRLLLSLLPLSSLATVLALGHVRQADSSANHSRRTGAFTLKGYTLNQQLTKGGAAVSVSLSAGASPSGAANLFPTLYSSSGAVLAVFNQQVSGSMTIPQTVNGITLSALVSNGAQPAPLYTSATLQAAANSSIAPGTGLVFNANNNTSQGTSYPSNSSNGTLDLVAALAAPSGVTATAQAGLQVVIDSTNKASQPSGTTYNLLESTTAGGEGTTPVASAITLPYTRQETVAGTKYYVLQAVNGGSTANSAEVSALAYNQQSGGSNVATGTAQAPSAGAVTGLSAVLADNGTAPRPSLSWALPASGGTLTGINVRRGTAAGGESATPLNSSPLATNATSFVDTTAAYATDYYYVVDSLSAGTTVSSTELHIKTDTSAPSLTVTAGNGVNTLNITNAGGTLGVLVMRGPHGGALTTLATLPNAAATYPDTTAVNGTAYDYQVFDLD